MKKGIENPNYRHGKYSKKFYCLDCRKQLSSGLASKCPNCSKIKKEKSYCIDCNKKLSKRIYTRCASCSRKTFIGAGNPMYIDGRTKLVKSIRDCAEYNIWRDKVYKRDNYTCQECNQRGYELEAHHKNPFINIYNSFVKKYNQFSIIEDKETMLRLSFTYKPFWELENGVTLCKKCHRLKGDKL